MADPNLSEVVATTLRKRRGKTADNVSNHNSLLRYLNARGRVETVDGGRTLTEELDYAENSTFMWYSGSEVLNTAASSVFSAAEYDPKQAAVSVQIDGRTRRMNAGKAASIKLLKGRLTNGERTLANNITTGIFSDGTGTGGKQVTGLQAQVADDPTTGTVGSINRATWSFWQNQTFDAGDAGAAAAASNMREYMGRLWRSCLRGADHPNLIVMDNLYYGHFEASLQSIQRITEEADATSGFRSLMFSGAGGKAPVIYDPACPESHGYMLNTDFLHWQVYRGANMEPLMERHSFNQDSTLNFLIFMGNLTSSNLSLQGVMKE